MAAYLTIDQLDVDGRTVLVRSDLNVPLADGAVTDDFRIRQSIPTIAALRTRGARVVVASHLGRPDGPDPSLSMAPVAAELGRLGEFDTVLAPGVAGPEVAAAVAGAPDGAVVVLENTRYEAGETGNAPELARALADLADLFVLDAFGSAHRAHASTVGVTAHLRSAAGTLLTAEVEALQRLVADPDRPFVVILGGAKVSDKLGVMRALLPKVDTMLIGGAMCFTILAADGYEVGDSRIEPDLMAEVREVLEGDYGGRITLPVDVVVADSFFEQAEPSVTAATNIGDGVMGLDIGPATQERFASILSGSDTVFWNGPMGVFEWEAFAAGTRAVAAAVASCPGYTVVGGGDSVAALRSYGLEGTVDHLSTGGGAGLELIEEGTLPGLEALEEWA